MAFSDYLRTVYVDGATVEAPQRISSAQLVKLIGQNPNNRSLVRANRDGTTVIYPPKEMIQLKDGDRYETQIPAGGG